MLRKGSVSRLWITVFVALVLSSLSTNHSAQAQVPELVFSVPDTSVASGEVETLLNIYITNYFDTIAGFQFVLVSERPDLVSFNFDNGGFDTAGTLVSGFEYVQSIDRAGDQSEIWFRCIANLPFDTINYRGFPPQQGGVAVKIPYDTAPLPDSVLTSIISVTTPVDFSDPWGYSLGVVTETIYDTTFYLCNLWQNDTCLEWLEVDPDSTGYDSLYVDTSLYGYLDTTRVIIIDGSITVQGSRLQCDFDSDGGITVVDLITFVQCLFGNPPPPPEVCQAIECDADGSGAVNVADITYLVNYLFFGGSPPV